MCVRVYVCVSDICCCGKDHDQKELGEHRVLFGLLIQSHSLLMEAKIDTKDINLEAGTEAEVMEKHCLMACLLLV